MDWLDDFMIMRMMEEELDQAEKEEHLESLREEISRLEDKLFEIECNEPDDIFSDVYTRWESKRDLVEEQIAEIESKIWDLEN